jgi:hypothetical protein
MFNALNRTTFASPNTDPFSSTVGKIAGTKGFGQGFQQGYFGYSPRVMEAALKFYW